MSIDGLSEGASARTRPDAADAQLARHVAELRIRLRSVCGDWDESAFEALLLAIARSKVRWASEGRGD